MQYVTDLSLELAPWKLKDTPKEKQALLPEAHQEKKILDHVIFSLRLFPIIFSLLKHFCWTNFDWYTFILVFLTPFHYHRIYSVLSVQFNSVAQLCLTFATPWIAVHQASLSINNSWSSPKLMSTESVMPSSHLILCRPLLLLPPTPPSIKVFFNESTLCMRWPEYCSFSFSISPSNEHSGLISFRMDWLDLLAVQGTLKSLLQHHSSKASILPHSAFFTVQLSHPYMTLEKS